jgi:hypothetical protein
MKMRNLKDPGATRIDFAGLVTFSAAMVLLELGLIRGDSLGWSSGAITVAVGALLAGGLVRGRDFDHPSPAVEPLELKDLVAAEAL